MNKMQYALLACLMATTQTSCSSLWGRLAFADKTAAKWSMSRYEGNWITNEEDRQP